MSRGSSRIFHAIAVIIAGLLGLCAVAVLVLSFVNWNIFRGPIARQSKARLGRELLIEGDLSAHLLSTCPRLEAQQLSFENAAWGTEPKLFSARHVAVELCLWPLLTGHLHLRDFELDGGRLSLEQNGDGVWNSSLAARSAPAASSKGGIHLPVWERIHMEDFKARVRRPEQKLIALDVTNLDSTKTSDAHPIVLSGKGMLQELPFDLDAKADTGATIVASAGLGFEVCVRYGTVTARAKGKVGDLSTLAPLKADFDLQAHGLRPLAAALGVSLSADVPALRLQGLLESDAQTVKASGLAGTLGGSRVTGWVALESGSRLKVRGALDWAVLRSKDLSGFLPRKVAQELPAERKKQAEAAGVPKYVLSDKPMDLSALRAIDADMDVRVAAFEGEGAAAMVSDFRVQVKLDDGKLDFAPIRVGLAGGHLEAKGVLDARQSILATAFDLAVDNVDMTKVLAPLAPDKKLGDLPLDQAITGQIQGHVKIATKGSSLHGLASLAGGEVGFTLEDGRISRALIELLGFDLTQFIGDLEVKRQTMAVDCMLASFGVDQGVVTTKGVVLGTPDSNVLVNGKIDLAQEQLDLKIKVLPKDFSVGVLRTPITVKGRFAKPQVGVEKGPLIARIASAIGLGALLGPAAALIPLIEPGTEKGGRCQQYAARIRGVNAAAAHASH